MQPATTVAATSHAVVRRCVAGWWLLVLVLAGWFVAAACSGLRACAAFVRYHSGAAGRSVRHTSRQ